MSCMSRLFVALACALSAGPLVAADRIEEVIVSASRIGVVDQLATVVEARDFIPSAHATDVLRGLPGLALASSGNRGALAQGRLRGAEANHLLVLIDGVVANDPATGSEFNFGAFDLAGVRRVELLPGPQSAVWGSDALAGVLLFDTTPASSHRHVAVGYGTHGTVDADLSLARVGDDGYGVLSLARSRSAGTNAALHGDEADGFANTTAHVAARRARGDWTFSSTARWTDAAADFDPTPAPRFVPQDGDRRAHSRGMLLSATVRFVGAERWQPWLTASSLRTKLANFEDGAVTNDFSGRRDTVTLAGNLDAGRHQLNLTLEAKAETFEQTAPVTPFGDPNQQQRTRATSVATEYQLRLDRLELSLSARRDFNSEFRHASAHRVGITTTGNPRWFANYGYGVKNPTFIERFGYTPDAFFGNPRLRPEIGRGVETGLDWRWRRGSWSVTIFQNILDDEINGFAFSSELGGFTARNLAGESRRQGAEAAFSLAFERLDLRGSWSYVDSKDGAGRREIRRPKHLASLAGRVAIDKRWSAGFAVSHNGESLDDDYSSFPATRVRLPGFNVARVDAEFAATPAWRLRLVVENVFNVERGTVFGYRAPGRSAMLRMRITR